MSLDWHLVIFIVLCLALIYATVNCTVLLVSGLIECVWKLLSLLKQGYVNVQVCIDSF